ncbi:MAG: GNAT family N-acetyltransferase [Bdellovibrionaceae bacterium]|nr:GNAT family N-acetyltransferase [Pseudobdellovibrionaceae bacterium]
MKSRNMQKTYLSEALRGSRITLRKHEPHLAPTMFASIEQDRERLRQYLPWVDLTRTVEDESNYIAMTLEAWSHYKIYDYGIFRNTDDMYLGNCGVHTISWLNDKCEIGYWLLGPFEGQGFMSEAVRILEQELFRLGFNRIEIRCNSTNIRSASVPRRNGYRLDSIVRRDADFAECRDTLVFAKIRELHFEDAADLLVGAETDHVILFTSDIQASREFYRRAFAVEPILDLPEICEFKIGTRSLILQPGDPQFPAGTQTELAYWPVEHFDQAVALLKSLGGEVFRGPLSLGDGDHICQIRDPLGNQIGLRGK